MMYKRVFDIAFSLLLIVVAIPIFLFCAVAVKLLSPGPVLFVQKRVGMHGKLFNLYKFRSMAASPYGDSMSITVKGDRRITRVGGVLRRAKLDELPQLFNVLKGDMSLVGPRPELKEYMDLYPDPVRERILSVRPGITDNASLLYIDEETILSEVDDPKKHYIDVVMPKKQKLYSQYIDNHSLFGDIVLLFKTLWSVLRR